MKSFLGDLIGVCTLAGLTAMATGCGPDAREDDGADSDGTDGDAPMPPDAGGFIDAAPVMPSEFVVYVHSRDTLYKLDETTLDPVLVGPFNAPEMDLITDMAVGPDGTLYGISKTKLYEVDPDDGHVTLLSTIQSGPEAGNVGLTTLPNGDLLATDEDGGVRKITPATGAVTEIGSFQHGLATAGDLVAVDDGTMYCFSDKGPMGDEFTNNWLITVNTMTGEGSAIGQIGYGKVFGAAFVNGKVLAFTSMGEIIEVNPMDGMGTPLKATGLEFWGAGVSSLVPGVD